MSIPAERLKELRGALGLSQEAFGQKVGLSRSEVRNLEYGITQIKDLTIPMICNAYGVSESWLQTGEGDMFRPISREAEIGQFMASVIAQEDSFSRRLVSVLARLDFQEWQLLEKMADKLLAEMAQDKQKETGSQ